jgi:large subunit ribosomal protein L15
MPRQTYFFGVATHRLQAQ